MDEPSTTPQEHVDLHLLDLTATLRPLDADHVATLTHMLDQCPPIVVHQPTLRLVDGHMRVAAARILGRSELPVRWVQGDEVALLELAVSINARHGLPLSQSQRKDAAQRILDASPQWSNRRVARACGVSESTVRRLRCPGASTTQLDTRVGADGKTYRTDTSQARAAAMAALAANPGQSNRAVGRRVGLSATTVGGLRNQLRTQNAAELDPTPGPSLLRRLWRWLARILRSAREPRC